MWSFWTGYLTIFLYSKLTCEMHSYSGIIPSFTANSCNTAAAVFILTLSNLTTIKSKSKKCDGNVNIIQLINLPTDFLWIEFKRLVLFYAFAWFMSIADAIHMV